MADDIKNESPERRRAIQESFIANLLYETPGGMRFTQDSPILPAVWTAYALEPLSQQELILTVNNSSGTGQAAKELREMLRNLRKKRPMVGPEVKRKPARVSYIPGQLAVRLYFDELIRIVLPLTPWWHEMYRIMQEIAGKRKDDYNPAEWGLFPQPDNQRARDLTYGLMLMRREIDPETNENRFWKRVFDADQTNDDHYNTRAIRRYIRDIPSELMWLVRIAGIINDCIETGKPFMNEGSLADVLRDDFSSRRNDVKDRIEMVPEREARIKEERSEFGVAFDNRRGIAESFLGIYNDWCKEKDNYPKAGVIWRATKNRPIELAVAKSALTVKADAARMLFDVSCSKITWAIIDSGIDGEHPAFRIASKEHEEMLRKKLAAEGDRDGVASKLKVRNLGSRVKLTLDFTRLREFLDFDVDAEVNDKSIKHHKSLVREIAGRIESDDIDKEEALEQASDVVRNLHVRIKEGRDINWQDLEKAIIVNEPPTPTNDHGTHVAGILGADWIEEYDHEEEWALSMRTRRMRGVCPDINLIDVRVFRESGLTDEFELLAAIQYLRWMNERAGAMKVHGANLSLSLIHEVRRFACGQTPICDECNEASALGMVMVAAAGNRGFELSDMDNLSASDSYKSASITDPGNADSVITVGSTHRKRPHEYGVSYFSSRGPTGDGRLKPDLVAPGEKIKGPTPNGRMEFKDGTSMAAPHVSGAAALLMARHSELIADPAKIKKILCETATDLGRERYFQGHGLVDILRAMQSV